jgi:hypothetical protein
MMTLQLRFQLREELDLGCREDVEVRECFSSPEILELKAQCELARYRVAAPNRLRGLLEKYPTFGREKETGLLGALDT